MAALTAVVILVIASCIFTLRGGNAQQKFWQIYRVCVLKLTFFMAACSGIFLLAVIAITLTDIIGRRLGCPLLGAIDLV